MKVTNNRSNAATFIYKWNNQVQKESFAAYQQRTFVNLTHVDQILSRQYIVNRTTSGTGTTASNFTTVTTPGLANNHVVNELKVVNNQTDGFWEIEA
ncbi:MAG: hypothetical protein P8J32_08220 [bacterium]|nr:hypothetical protein [bacterium]